MFFTPNGMKPAGNPARIIALHRLDRRSNGGAVSGQAWRDDSTDR
jgi:hypothetical protein